MTFNTELWNGAAPAAPEAIEIERSLRFNSADSSFLNRTPASAGNRKTWTWAGWVKRSGFVSNRPIFGTNFLGSSYCSLYFDGNNTFFVENYISGFQLRLQTAQVFRDPSAWYHIVVALDTTQGTASDRCKIYVNGSQVTAFSISTYPSQNTDLLINNNQYHEISTSSSSYGFNGYLADVHFIDGQALDHTSFGFFDDNGIWQPIEYTGSYGTNGFHLDFSDNSSNAALGDDTSGNGNDWTVNNISATADSSHSFTESGLGLVMSIYKGGPFLPRSGAPTGSYPPGYTFDTGSSTVYRFTLATAGVVTVYSTTSNGAGVPTVRFPETGQSQSYGYLNGVVQTFTSNAAVTYFEYYMSSPSGGQAGYLNGVDVGGVPVVVNPAGNDSLRDSPTNGDTANDTGLGGEVPGNYATLNPLDHNTGSSTFSNGNLKIVTTTSTGGVYVSTMATPTTGKWYAEATMVALSQNTYSRVGLVQVGQPRNTNQLGNSAGQIAYRVEAGDIRYNLTTLATGGSAASNGDIIGIALDLDNQTLKIYKNGVLQVTASNIPQYEWFFAGADDYQVYSATHEWNFGQRPFAYQAPSGFKALCTTNLPTPTIADGSDYMDVALYTGNNTSQTISGLEFSPDLVWIKSRSTTATHGLFDVVRGALLKLRSNNTDAELSVAGSVTSFTSDGFAIGGDGGVNANSVPYVAWTWDAGSSTVSNTDGSITSSVRANASAGFSVVKFSGYTYYTDYTIGHGLSVQPSLIICRDSNKVSQWGVYHSGLTAGHNLYLNDTSAAASRTSLQLFVGSPTSSVFTYRSNNGGSGHEGIAYCFAPIEGYSAFGSYTSNNSSDGPFIYTGFRPRYVLIKNITSGNTNWRVMDSARDDYNDGAGAKWLKPNTSDAEVDERPIDFLSNGFKIRVADGGDINYLTNTMIWVAFAENPFALNARAR